MAIQHHIRKVIQFLFAAAAADAFVFSGVAVVVVINAFE